MRRPSRFGDRIVSGIVGFVFIVTMLNCVFGLIDQIWQAIKRKRASHG